MRLSRSQITISGQAEAARPPLPHTVMTGRPEAAKGMLSSAKKNNIRGLICRALSPPIRIRSKPKTLFTERLTKGLIPADPYPL